MNANELKSFADQVEELVEGADNQAANGNYRAALYNVTSAVNVLLALVSALAREPKRHAGLDEALNRGDGSYRP